MTGFLRARSLSLNSHDPADIDRCGKRHRDSDGAILIVIEETIFSEWFQRCNNITRWIVHTEAFL